MTGFALISRPRCYGFNMSSSTKSPCRLFMIVPDHVWNSFLCSRTSACIDEAQYHVGFPHACAYGFVVQDLRDIALGTPDALEGLLLNVTQPASQSLLRNCVWALSNMCRGKPQPEIAKLAPALPVLLTLLSSEDSEV